VAQPALSVDSVVKSAVDLGAIGLFGQALEDRDQTDFPLDQAPNSSGDPPLAEGHLPLEEGLYEITSSRLTFDDHETLLLMSI